ncbi:porphobilinogen deaminase [Microthyrium microscopicum]|uniref:Porphobilinogen deaminase n=1 Tax=Microthyrium microscopicum TaxID=703497 RepID=A0A6A6U6G6_9PEZI|nr:porphobilinogen deaminase [Microthyrium microscopicum]
MSSPQQFTIGTRRSALARVQTDLVAASLKTHYPSLEISIHAMDPLGDRDKTTALYKLSDQLTHGSPSISGAAAAKSVWTGEFEELLAAKKLHAIVHSLKDMATSSPEGLILGAVLERADPRDALCLPEGHSLGRGNAQSLLKKLGPGAIVGTSSLRRIAQLRRGYPQLRFEVARGNVPTRLRKLDEPESFEGGVKYAALILAAAGLIRLDLGDRIDAYLSGEEEHGGMLYAVGQGAIGIQVREDDAETRAMLEKINHSATWLAIHAERALLRALEGGCSVPIGVEASWKGTVLVLRAVVVSVDGQNSVEVEEEAEVTTVPQAELLGMKIAGFLVDNGASGILDAINEERRKEREEEEAKFVEEPAQEGAQAA